MFFFMAGLHTEGKELGSVLSLSGMRRVFANEVFSAFECLRVFFIPVLRFHRRYFILTRMQFHLCASEEDGRPLRRGKSAP